MNLVDDKRLKYNSRLSISSNKRDGNCLDYLTVAVMISIPWKQHSGYDRNIA